MPGRPRSSRTISGRYSGRRHGAWAIERFPLGSVPIASPVGDGVDGITSSPAALAEDARTVVAEPETIGGDTGRGPPGSLRAVAQSTRPGWADLVRRSTGGSDLAPPLRRPPPLIGLRD